MGYKKIIQYGNITEYYEYQNEIKQKKGIDHKKALLLLDPKQGYGKKHSLSVIKKRQKQLLVQSKAKGVYIRIRSSINRSKRNFWRLCHHNNVYSDTIHFLTLTFAYDLHYKEAQRHVSEFFRRVQNNYPQISLRYISVPELTKKGRYHFHLLLYDLPPQTSELERKTRNFQRLFRKGFLDLSYAEYTSKGIAGYMSKYMGKALTDSKNGCVRGYNTSRNVYKTRSYGSNNFTEQTDIIPDTDIDNIEKMSYDVPYLGNCKLIKITTKI
jgi:hypothetical protein